MIDELFNDVRRHNAEIPKNEPKLKFKIQYIEKK